MSSSTTANIKGLKFQSYKVIRSLVKSCVEGEEASVYYAIERFDDDSIIDVDKNTNSTGQAKYYSSKFSLNSDEVQKALRNFYKYYKLFIEDDSAHYEFYTNVSYKGENKGELITTEEAKEIRDDGKCFLELLANKEFEDHEETIKTVIGRILDPNNPNANHDNVIPFLERIEWNFGMEPLDEIEKETIELLKEVKYYNYEFKGKEKYIFSYLVQRIEKMALGKNSLSSYINFNDLKYAFRDLMDNEYKIIDDASAEFKALKVDNSRNIIVKISDVCTIDNPRFYKILNRNITRAKSDHSKVLPEKSATYLYRIYEISDEILYNLSKEDIKFSESKINEIINTLYLGAKEYLEDRKQDFSYAFNSDDIIRNSILLLFNECYLSFA